MDYEAAVKSAQRQALRRHLNDTKKRLRAQTREEEIQSPEFKLKLAKRQIAEATLRAIRQNSRMPDSDSMSDEERDVKRLRTTDWRKARIEKLDDDTDSVSSVSAGMSDDEDDDAAGDSDDADTDDDSDDASSSSDSTSSSSDEEEEEEDNDNGGADQPVDDDATSSESEVDIVEIVRQRRHVFGLDPESSSSSESD
jgi:hypothetical protein